MPSELAPVKQMDLLIRGMCGTGCYNRTRRVMPKRQDTPPLLNPYLENGAFRN